MHDEFPKLIYWRIIACESSDYQHIVHDDGFVWLMFVHERFSASEQTLNSQNHGVHYMLVITRLNAIILFHLRETPQTDKPTEMTQLMTRFCVFLALF